ncbi:hypothetical protein C8J56DRAFT_792630 [Mycena floridula]|nr:hypothetical protein C8J56DRAFT_792630 [Mycena floridula]
MDVDDYHQKREEDNEEDSEALFHWQDEKTLVADLMHNGDRRESTDDALHSLIDALQSPFDKRAKDLVNNIAVTLIPAAKRVRESHFRLNEEFDPTYSLAMLETDEAYKKNEAVVSTIHEQYSAACTASKERQFELMEQLKAACQERDALWNAFEARFQEACKSISSSA